MKVLFIHTDIHRHDPEDYGFNGLINWCDMQFGISYISSCLRKFNHSTSLLFINRHKWEEIVLNQLEKYDPNVLCLGGVSTQFKYVLKISEFIKKRFPNAYQVYGGIHATLADMDLSGLPFDAICKGEGEFPIIELIQKMENKESIRDIMNLTIKENGDIFSNATRPFLQDLDELPFPDREMWKQYISPDAFTKHALLLSRGCPFECTYCSNKALSKVSEGRYVRFRRPESVVDEIKFIKRKYPEVNDIFLESETVVSNLSWLEEFCEILHELNSNFKTRLKFGTNIRITPKTDYSPIFKILKKAGFEYISIGIESGSERIRKCVLHRNYSNEDVITVFREAQKYNLETHAYNMVGLPGETLGDFQETVRINRICQPKDPHLCIFFPYLGTDLFKECNDKGILKYNINYIEEREDAALQMDSFPAGIIEKYYARFEWDIYRGKKNSILFFWRYLYKRFVMRHKALLKTYIFLRKRIINRFKNEKVNMNQEEINSKPYIRHDSIIGYRYIPNTEMELTGPDNKKYVVKINSMGIRSDKEYSLKKPKGIFRVLVFGDSITAGQYAKNEDRFTEQLEKMIPGTEFINFGLEGTGTDQQFLIFKHLASSFEYDAVLLCPFVENIRRNMVRYRLTVDLKSKRWILTPKPRFEQKLNGGWCWTGIPVSKERPFYNEATTEILEDTDFGGSSINYKIKDNLKFVGSKILEQTNTKGLLYSVVKHEPYKEYKEPLSQSWQTMKAILSEFIKLANEKKFIVAPIVPYSFLRYNLANTYRRRFSEECEYFIDILPYLKALSQRNRKKCYILHDCHLSQIGHRHIARAIADELQRLKILER